jgi:benzoyl-CoA reductase/2-hydroxyglutaryl-CoA dehydratase subunit BcrC/BadD/HgdB
MESKAKHIPSKLLLKKMTLDYYIDLNKARYNGRKVAWASSIVPQEFMEAMDIAVAYPENHSATIAAKKGAMKYIDHADEMGYSNDICSYARINLAYADLKCDEVFNLPKPDFVVCTNNICSVLVKWYEALAEQYNVPFFLIDVPFNYDYDAAKKFPDNDPHHKINYIENHYKDFVMDITQERIDYIKDQFYLFIKFLEKMCGKKFDYDKFNKVMEISNRCGKAWAKAMEYAEKVPSPLDGFNMFNYMALMVCMRGKESSVKLYELIAQEMEENMKEGKSQFPFKQQHRIMWDGIACWPYLRHNYTTLAKNGIVISGSTYPKAWELVYDVGNMDELAAVYAGIGNNRCMAYQSDTRAMIQQQCNCDGVVYHMNRSCKVMDFMQPEMRRQIYDMVHIPYISFDGDQSDPKNFSKAQFENRIQGLVENMDAQEKEEVQ